MFHTRFLLLFRSLRSLSLKEAGSNCPCMFLRPIHLLRDTLAEFCLSFFPLTGDFLKVACSHTSSQNSIEFGVHLCVCLSALGTQERSHVFL